MSKFERIVDDIELKSRCTWTAKAVADIVLVTDVLVAVAIFGVWQFALGSSDLASVRTVAPFWLTIYAILLIKRRGFLNLQRVFEGQFHGVLDWVVASALSTACWLAASTGTWEAVRLSSVVALSGAVVLYLVEIARRRIVKRLTMSRNLGDRVEAMPELVGLGRS